MSGWDTLHPEFNIKQYLERISSAWQEHQGLGAPPSQAHLAELPRMLIFIFLYLFPLNFIRYSYFFLTIILGPVGMYLLLKYLFQPTQKDNLLIAEISAFIGALFYLLNVGIVQLFIAPFEMFATKFAVLGFVYLYLIKFLKYGQKKDLLIFCLINILAAPMAHTATLWYVYFLGICLYCLTYLFLSANKKIVFKKVFVVILSTLILNLYWLLPQIYYSYNYSSTVINSKINRPFSAEDYYYNKKYGNLKDLLIFRNYLFDWKVINNKNQSQYLLSAWIEHLKNPYILMIGYLLTLSSVFGLIFAFKRKSPFIISFLPIMILSAFFLLSNVKGISFIFDSLRAYNPLFAEVFRAPFTKFSLCLIFSSSVFLGFFNKAILEKISKLASLNEIKQKFYSFTYFYIFLALIIFYSLPAFNANFISPIERVRIPEEYFNLFLWSQNKNNGRILTLPMPTLYGWLYYQWAFPEGNQIYQGAGFNWFGLKQASLNREFDRWYPYNEQSYREFSYALYSQNLNLFEKLLSKYRINYILLDKNVIVPGDQNQSNKLFYPETERLLASSKKTKLIQSLGQNIKIYQYLPNINKRAVEIFSSLNLILPSFHWNYVDQAYLENGDYITEILSPDLNKSTNYPSRNILNEEERVNKQVLTINNNSYQLRLNQKNNSGTEFFLPNLVETEDEFYSDVYFKKDGKNSTIVLDYLLPYTSEQSPYQQEFAIPFNNIFSFSINNQVFDLPTNNNQDHLYLGEVILTTKNPNKIIYYGSNKKEISYNLPPSLYPYLCSPGQDKQIFGAQNMNSGIQLYGQRAKVCLDLPFDKFIEETDLNGLINLNFVAQLESNIQADVCVYDQIENRCLIRKNLKKYIFKDQSTSLSFPLIKDHHPLLIKFSLNTINNQTLQTMTIINLSLDLTRPEGENEFYPELSATGAGLLNPTIKGELPEQSIAFDLSQLSSEKKDCGVEKARFINKRLLTEDNDNILVYQAENSAICDAVYFPELSRQTGYILAIESKNLSGLPLRLCFENDKTKTCAIEDILSKNKDFDIDYFIIPPYFDGYGYNLILTNLSIGNVYTENQIKKIQIIPFPYVFFQSIKEKKSQQQPQSINRLISTNIKKLSPWLYSASINEPVSLNSVLVLDQAFEKNWKAYRLKCQMTNVTCQVYSFFPFIFGEELKDHVLINNWANGWALHPQQAGFAPQGAHIVIIFLPQYLEFFGFVILILGLFFILYRKPRQLSTS